MLWRRWSGCCLRGRGLRSTGISTRSRRGLRGRHCVAFLGRSGRLGRGGLLRRHRLTTLLWRPASARHPVPSTSRDRLTHLRATESGIRARRAHSVGTCHSILHAFHEERAAHLRWHLATVEIHGRGRSTTLGHCVTAAGGTRESGLGHLRSASFHLVVRVGGCARPTALGRGAWWQSLLLPWHWGLAVRTGHAILLLTSHHQAPLILLFKQHKLHLIILESMIPMLTARCLQSSPNLGHLTIRWIVIAVHRVHTLAIWQWHQVRLIWHDTGIYQTTIRHALVIHC